MSGAPAHRLAVRVYYEDTDAGGIVYHAAYLRFAERARTEMLREAGLDHVALKREHGVLFAVRRCLIEFTAPARLDDLLHVETTALRAGGARLALAQAVTLDGRPVAALEVELAVLGADDLRPRRLPAALREYLAAAPSAAGGPDAPARP